MIQARDKEQNAAWHAWDAQAVLVAIDTHRVIAVGNGTPFSRYGPNILPPPHRRSSALRVLASFSGGSI